MKNYDSKEKLQPKLRVVSVMDGFVDFSRFEIEIFSNKKIYKVIRNPNEDSSKRKRPVYSGITNAIFYECEQKLTSKNLRFIDDL